MNPRNFLAKDLSPDIPYNLIRFIAHSLAYNARHIRWMDEEDLVQEGICGILQSDYKDSAKVGIIARHAMIDALRTAHDIRDNHYRQNELAYPEKWKEMLVDEHNPAILVERQEYLNCWLEKLNDVVYQRIFHGLLCGKTEKEIGEQLGYNESRVSQMRTMIMRRWDWALQQTKAQRIKKRK